MVCGSFLLGADPGADTTIVVQLTTGNEQYLHDKLPLIVRVLWTVLTVQFVLSEDMFLFICRPNIYWGLTLLYIHYI